MVDAWCHNAELLGVEQCPSLAVFILGPFSKSLPCIPVWVVGPGQVSLWPFLSFYSLSTMPLNLVF